MDLLARLHLEFLLDPLDLGLRHIVLTGEIASRRTIRQLAGEFEAAVTEVYADPFSGGALAWRAAEERPADARWRTACWAWPRWTRTCR